MHSTGNLSSSSNNNNNNNNNNNTNSDKRSLFTINSINYTIYLPRGAWPGFVKTFVVTWLFVTT